jgi:hypothetical protein
MKFTADRHYASPEVSARKLIEIANSVEPAQDGRIFIELINWPFFSEHKGTPPNTRLASIWRLLAAGYGCMNPGLT